MNLVQLYVDQFNAFGKADSHVKELAYRLESFANAMTERPNDTCFVDVADEPRPPLDELMTGRRWYAPEFPTADSLQDALRSRFNCRQQLRTTWEKMTAAQRKNAPPPPS